MEVNKQEHEGSIYLHHEPCPQCGSTDNLGVYSDGHKFCFGCRHYERATDSPATRKTNGSFGSQSGSRFIASSIQALPKRGLDESTCRLFNFGVGEYQGEPCFVRGFKNAAGELVAQNIKRSGGRYTWIGDHSQVGMFGEHLWPSGRRLVITEGYEDALSVSQVMNNKWPVVSIPDGAASAGKYVKKRYEYLTENFETIVLMFDMDRAGQEAVQAVAEILPPDKVKIAKLPMKDANECLVAGKVKEILNAFWNAVPYRPDGIVSISDIKEQLFTPVTWGAAWPWTEMTNMTYGRRVGEIYAIGAGVGVGKTDLFTECITYDLTTLKEKVGVIYLEQPVDETVQRIAGKMRSKLFHIPDEDWTMDEYKAAVEELEATDGLWLYNHFGGKDWTTITAKIRYFAKVLGIKYVYLDHLTALVSSADDERRALDAIMEQMASLAMELQICIHFISHLTTPDGKPHEEGGRVMEKHFTGSRAIARWSHYMFGLERNKQAEDVGERATMTVRVLKDRRTGRATGCTFQLYYNRASGRLTESLF